MYHDINHIIITSVNKLFAEYLEYIKLPEAMGLDYFPTKAYRYVANNLYVYDLIDEDYACSLAYNYAVELVAEHKKNQS